MAVVMSLNTSVSNVGSPAVVGEARVGNNGDPWGAPEYDVGNPNNLTDGFTTWDSSDLSSGFDTGSQAFSFNASTEGSNLSIGNASDGPLSGDGTNGSINQVLIRVDALDADMDAKLSGVTVDFYDDGTLTDSVSVGDLEAQTTDSQPVLENMAVVSAPADTDQVVVTGNIEFSCSVPYEMPDVNDMFAQVDVS